MFTILYYVIVIGLFLKLLSRITLGLCKSQTCLVGKTAIVTGGNSGIGYQTALGLAGRGCKVIIADLSNSEESTNTIIKSTGNKNISWRFLDLGSLESVREFATGILESEKRLDILINNAGIFGCSGIYSDDGLFKCMHVNHLGMFLLTHLLVDLLKETPKSRIVIVTSTAAFTTTLNSAKDMNKPACTWIKVLQSYIDYSNSKICNLIASNIFAEKLQKYGVTCNAVYPGIVETSLMKSTSPTYKRGFWKNILLNCFIFSFKYFKKSPFEGGQTSLHAALSKDLENVTGKFFVDCISFVQPRITGNRKFCKDIWDESERLVKLKPEERIK